MDAHTYKSIHLIRVMAIFLFVGECLDLWMPRYFTLLLFIGLILGQDITNIEDQIEQKELINGKNEINWLKELAYVSLNSWGWVLKVNVFNPLILGTGSQPD